MAEWVGMLQDATLGDGQAAVEAGLRLERLETCLPATAYDRLHFPDPPAVRTLSPPLLSCRCTILGVHRRVSVYPEAI